MLSNQTSTSTGKVTIDLGTGVYDASSTSVTAGFTWTTGGKSFDLTVGGIKAGTGNVFVLGAGTLTHNLNFTSKSFGTNLYFSNDRSITANNIKDLTNDPTAEYHSLDDLNNGLTSGSGFSGTTGNITLSSTTVYAGADNTVTFWNVRNGDVNARLNVKEIRFGGAQNKFASFTNTATGPNSDTAPATILKGSVLRGYITLGSAGISFEEGARAIGGTIVSVTTMPFVVNFKGDYQQELNDSAFVAAHVSFKSQGTSIRLLKADPYTGLSVETNGGNFQMKYSGDLKFRSLNSGGGSVVLDSTGSISGTGSNWLSAGSVSFRAGGSVVLNGFFASASGTGASVSLINSAAGFVLGGISASSSVTVTGTGTAILEGDVIGSGAVSFGSAVTVARDSSVAASGGRIDFAKTVAALNAAVGLRLDAGYGGVISLGANIGTPTLSLGWVDLTGTVNNPAGSIFARQTTRRPGI